jgi:hypothetical protein
MLEIQNCVFQLQTMRKHTEVIRFLQRNFKRFSRCGFLSLPVGGEVGQHIDVGSYYLTRDRYHLAIQGSYVYTVGGESLKINAGDLIWFKTINYHMEPKMLVML